MNYRKIATGMIEATYDNYKDWKKNEDFDLIEELNAHNDDIPVWCEMNDNTKCAAIEYVYKNRKTIELHSGCVEAWVQATAYFMLYSCATMMIEDGQPSLEMFFDDMDFMMDEDILEDGDVQAMLGISPDFTENF
jgi:hypothetical protein